VKTCVFSGNEARFAWRRSPNSKNPKEGLTRVKKSAVQIFIELLYYLII
jgi:hypothetical protein